MSSENISIQPNISSLDDPNIELKYNMCKYCKGVIPKLPRKYPFLMHCGKICSETNKMVPNDNYVYSESNWLETTGKEWCYYKEILKEKSAPATSQVFAQNTREVPGLETGMKLEALDINSPVNICVATVISIKGHRLCIRYDGFGSDNKYDFWSNFQAEELYPIGWCAKHGYDLQPPTGISSTLSEWKSFLTNTLAGSLAAPPELFRKPEERRQLRCHPYNNGNKVEVIHPKRPDLIVSASISKSLGPYYFLIKTDLLPDVPVSFFYGYADCPGVYPSGWCESKGLELLTPSNCFSFQELTMRRKLHCNVEILKRSRSNPLRIGQKLEVVDNEDVRVATVAEFFGRVAMVMFDGTERRKFVDRSSSDLFPVGWCEATGHILKTPYGKVNFASKIPSHIRIRNSEKINSASFSAFQSVQTNASSVKIAPVQNEKYNNIPSNLSQSVDLPIQSANSEALPTNSQVTSAVTIENSIDTDTMDSLSIDEVASPPSPFSPAAVDQQKFDMETFIVWLLNHYVYDNNDTECAIKPDLVDYFTESTNIRLSPRWFSLIYKLFAGVNTVRRSFEGKFVNCFRNLKLLKNVPPDAPVYFRDAVDLFRNERVRVVVGEEKIVAYMGVGDNYTLPDDTEEIFMSGKAKQNSKILVIVAEVAKDFRVTNCTLFFENKLCSSPLQKLSTIYELRALIKLCKQARLCRGVPVVPKADNTTPNYRHGKYVKNGRLYTSNCNVVAFAHKNFTCCQCKGIRSHGRPPPACSSDIDSFDSMDREDDESLPKGGEDDNVSSPDIRVHFNTSCYPGIYLDPVKVLKMKSSTQLDRPAQVLKYVVEYLVEVSSSKDRLLEIIEAGFGTRIFNKTKDKVVKKGLFRFNTRRKVIRFLKRLTKRLNCCDFFLSIDPRDCMLNCKKNFDDKTKIGHGVSTSSIVHASDSILAMSRVVSSPVSSIVHSNQNFALASSNHKNKLQLVYQVPVVSLSNTSTQSTPSTPTIMVQTPDGVKMHNRFSQSAQFFVPSNANNLTYMVVSKEGARPVNQTVTKSYSSSQSTGVTHMIANVSKAHLVSDIDDPSKTNRTSQISVVKSGNVSNQQILIKKKNFEYPVQFSRSENCSIQTKLDANPVSPPSYHDATRTYHYPRSSDDNNYSRNEKTQSGDKQIQVHKVHHGSARVKYVEFKPAHESEHQQKLQVYNTGIKLQHPQQTQVHYPHRQQSNQSQYLTVHTPGLPPKSPLHSPPALRPPPPVHQRPMALSSPPNLMPSPEIRPRFDFAKSQSLCSTSLHSPVQVSDKHSFSGKTMHAHLNQNIRLPRLPSSYQLTSLPQQNPAFIRMQNTTSQATPASLGDNIENRYVPGSSSGLTPVSMTYIPIQTSSKDKFVYVPVQSGQNQQVVLYQNNKDGTSKPMIITPQKFQNQANRNVIKEQASLGPFTTVRIQGLPQTSYPSNGQNSPSTPTQVAAPDKTFKYQFGGDIVSTVPFQVSNTTPRQQHSTNSNNSPSYIYDSMKQEIVNGADNSGEIMTKINDQLRRVPPNIGIRNQDHGDMHKPGNSGIKRDASGTPTGNNYMSPFLVNCVNDMEKHDIKVKKKRGRPVSARKPEGARSKLSMMQVNPLSGSNSGNPITLAKRVLTETYYKKQQYMQNRVNFLHNPLAKLPNLPANPEKWTADDVYTFLMATDCYAYAGMLKKEEIDGKSFLLMTREVLMEFMGMKLGPALKISGHASYLRAKHRMQSMNQSLLEESNRLSTNTSHVMHPKPSVKEENFDAKKIKIEMDVNETVTDSLNNENNCLQVSSSSNTNQAEGNNSVTLDSIDGSKAAKPKEVISGSNQTMVEQNTTIKLDVKGFGNVVGVDKNEQEVMNRPDAEDTSKRIFPVNQVPVSNEANEMAIVEQQLGDAEIRN